MTDAAGGVAGAGSGVAEAARSLRARLGRREPRIAVVLGSGLGGLAARFEDAVEVSYEEIPGWPPSGVVGHAGKLVAGELRGVQAIGLSGRVHLYEGHAPARVAFGVRVLGRLGVPALLLSNAAGAVNRTYVPGDLMLIADHIDLMFRSPLAGPVAEGETRFPDMSAPYDRFLRGLVRETAREVGVRLHEGVYCGLLGPSYETPAEIRMLERIGADAVGMSTVPEVIAARARGIRCVGVSCLTNYAAGLLPEPLHHEEVLETTERVADAFQELVARSVEAFARAGEI